MTLQSLQVLPSRGLELRTREEGHMSDDSIHSLLSAYFVLYVGLTFGWRTYRVYRQTRHNPFVLATGDDADGYVGRAFGATIVGCLVVIVAPVIEANIAGFVGPLASLADVTRIPGVLLLGLSLVGVVLAQAQMGRSWRVGIDRAIRTDLVEHGLFARSRNPIFLSMRATLLGVFLVIPSAASLAVLVAGEILMQVQVRLEESHLAALHGAAYAAYRARVPRWL